MKMMNEDDGKLFITLAAVYVAGVITGLVNSDVTINVRTILVPFSILMMIGAVVYSRGSSRKANANRPNVEYPFRKN